ncbi:hypothetical protein EDD27_1507 [Nonomuraea polychroma]|uniref:Uncharacterized protein n=1 Tax=Nonomuraea polychroma TaxID=46176 RepID=A0A438M043_9ACTN|nr:hypothetical protein [Nonomuraea polychroma]RVX39160.1 hypothetical protein EDD27_1507 [Nonomuraea polychroma]
MISASTLVRFSGSTPRPAAADVAVTRLRLFDTSVWMAYRRDDVEWARRAQVGLGAVLAWDLLDLLMALPEGFPVPLRSLPRSHKRRLYRAPGGVATITADTVTRHIVPPVTPLLAVVTATDLHDGLVRASRFAAYCSRMTLVPSVPGNRHEELAMADLYGIGVAVVDQRPARVLVEPESLTDWQPTTAWWRFTETIYRQATGKLGV